MARAPARRRPPVVVVVNKVDDELAREPTSGSVHLGLGEPHAGVGAARAGSGDLLDAVVAAPAGARRRDPRRSPRTDRERAVLGRDRRPTQRRQVDAVQPARRRRPRRRARPAGHDPRLDRHGRRDRGRAAPLRRHRGHAPPEPHRRAHRVLQPRARRSSPSTAPTPPSSSSTRPTASPTRTSDSPSASTPPAPRRSWSSTSGTCSDAEQRRDVLQQVADRLAFLAYAPASRSPPSPAASVRHVLPALREAEAAYHRRVPTAALNRVSPRPSSDTPPPVVRKRRPACSTPPKVQPTRRRSRSSRRTSCRRRTFGTSSAGSVTRSTSGRPVKIRVRLRGR